MAVDTMAACARTSVNQRVQLALAIRYSVMIETSILSSTDALFTSFTCVFFLFSYRTVIFLC